MISLEDNDMKDKKDSRIKKTRYHFQNIEKLFFERCCRNDMI